MAALALCTLLTTAALVGAVPAAGEPLSPRQAIERLFLSETPEPEWFAPSFLAQVPASQVQLVIAQLAASLGEYQGVEEADGEYLVHFAAGIVPVHITLDDAGLIAGLFLRPPIAKSGSLDEAVAAFQQLPGRISLLVVKESAVLAALNADAPLAAASAFKLAVLAALKAEIDAGLRSWSDVVTLTDEAKSLPTGVLHTWPTGSPLTLHTLATAMISASDNTATDLLIHVIGREKVENFAPRNRPLLTTREAFVLKNPEHAARLAAYRAAEPAARRQLLDELSQLSLPSPALLTGDPVALDIEWYFTAWELCGLMGYVEELPLMHVNPGPVRTADWERVAYKGGSEPGVLTLVSALRDHNGERYCVAALWNDNQPLDEARFVSLYTGLVSALAHAPSQ